MNHLLLTLTLAITSGAGGNPGPPFALLRAGIRPPAAPPAPPIRLNLVVDSKPDRLGNALLGAAIGGAAGIITCTVISNIVKDPGSGVSTCTWKGYLLLGGTGAGLGALIGALVH